MRIIWIAALAGMLSGCAADGSVNWQAVGAVGAAMSGAGGTLQPITDQPSAPVQPPTVAQPIQYPALPAPPVTCRTVFVGNVANTQCF